MTIRHVAIFQCENFLTVGSLRNAQRSCPVLQPAIPSRMSIHTLSHRDRRHSLLIDYFIYVIDTPKQIIPVFYYLHHMHQGLIARLHHHDLNGGFAALHGDIVQPRPSYRPKLQKNIRNGSPALAGRRCFCLAGDKGCWEP